MSKPSLYVVAVSTSSGSALFGRRTYQLSVLNRRSKLLRLSWNGEVFDELEDSFVTFARDFDWVVWKNADGTMYVLNSGAFHAEFRDIKALRQAVEDNVLTIRSKIEIDNADEMIERCRVIVPMASKLKRVVEHGLLDTPVPTLKKYGEDRGIDVTWNGDAMVYENTIEKQWNILKLLDEDHTVGPVTGRTYDSPAKREIS